MIGTLPSRHWSSKNVQVLDQFAAAMPLLPQLVFLEFAAALLQLLHLAQIFAAAA
jgi:hypothetical protein